MRKCSDGFLIDQELHSIKSVGLYNWGFFFSFFFNKLSSMSKNIVDCLYCYFLMSLVFLALQTNIVLSILIS